MSSLDQQVSEAALAMVHPSTDAAHRSAASSFLEQWNNTPEAWITYQSWLRSFATEHSSIEASTLMGTRLLCLTMLLQKIRRSSRDDGCLSVKDELWSLLFSEQEKMLAGPLASCVAAVAIRSNALNQIVSLKPATPISMRLLVAIPPEMDACGELTTSQVANELWKYMGEVLNIVYEALASNDATLACLSLEVLCKWTSTSRVTLTLLNSPTSSGGSGTLLPILIQVLSQQQPPDESMLRFASETLTSAILVPSDLCTPAREDVVRLMVESISHGFIAAPMAWEGNLSSTEHAMATAICTLVSEEVEFVCSKPAPPALLNVLFYIQAHPHNNVTMTVLECWLTIQDVSTSERHEDWKKPLFSKVVEGLIARVAYPQDFITWDDSDLDKDEFQTLRMWVADVYVSSYFLLRSHLISQVTGYIGNSDWTRIESALSTLSCVSLEVCKRLKTNRAIFKQDQETTVHLLLSLAESLLHKQAEIRQHGMLWSTACKFLGDYAFVWNSHCPPNLILGLLAFCRDAMSSPDAIQNAARATRSLYVGCSERLLSSMDQQVVDSLEGSIKEASRDSECVGAVAEGCTRLIVKLPDQTLVLQMLGRIVEPLVRKTRDVLPAMANHEQANEACDEIEKNLNALQQIVKFLDVPVGSEHPLTHLLPTLLELCENVVKATNRESVIRSVMNLHQQMLKTAPQIVQPQLSQAMTMVMDIFDRTRHDECLAYVSTAVEAYSPLSPELMDAFGHVLTHVASSMVAIVNTSVSQERNSQALIAAFYQMNNRFVLFCPTPLIIYQEFQMVVALAVECLKSVQLDSQVVAAVTSLATSTTKAALLFLSHLFGWRHLRLSHHVVTGLESGSARIDEMYRIHGETICHSCISGLLGGSSVLWPALSDCLLAILSYNPEQYAVAQSWIYTAMTTSKPVNGDKRLSPKDCEEVVKVLFNLLQQGSKTKPKAKMLLSDLAKISKGEMSSDALLTAVL